MSSTENPQTSIYEKTIEDPDLEKLLETRSTAKTRESTARQAAKDADGAVKSAIAAHPELADLGIDAPVRIGKWIITRKESKPSEVAFTRGGGTRLQISLLDD